MTKQFNAFRFPVIASAALMATLVGLPSNLLAQSEAAATIKLDSIQQQDLDHAPTADQPHNLTPSTGLVSEQRIKSIHERIDLIKQLVEKEANEAEMARQAELEKMNALLEPQPPTEFPDVAPDRQPASETPAAEVPLNDNVAPPVSGTPVMAKPINPFKLASSLFRTGNITASRRSYEAGLADAGVDEKVWLTCLIACCYRLEGNFESAETTFREVTNQRGGTYAVDYAKWSLDYVDQRRNAAQRFQEIELEIDQIMTKRAPSKSKK